MSADLSFDPIGMAIAVLERLPPLPCDAVGNNEAAELLDAALKGFCALTAQVNDAEQRVACQRGAIDTAYQLLRPFIDEVIGPYAPPQQRRPTP